VIQELAFDKMNRHRAIAELVIYNRNWLPWWLITSVLAGFCDHAERFLNGEAQPPFLVRLWWTYRHWCFRRNVKKTSKQYLRENHKDRSTQHLGIKMALSKLQAGERSSPLLRKIARIPIEDYVFIEGRNLETGEVENLKVDRAMLCNFNGIPQVPGSHILVTNEADYEVDARQLVKRAYTTLSTAEVHDLLVREVQVEYPRKFKRYETTLARKRMDQTPARSLEQAKALAQQMDDLHEIGPTYDPEFRHG
jgi:hypothetical protein